MRLSNRTREGAHHTDRGGPAIQVLQSQPLNLYAAHQIPRENRVMALNSIYHRLSRARLAVVAKIRNR